jgi:hypothetical protein
MALVLALVLVVLVVLVLALVVLVVLAQALVVAVSQLQLAYLYHVTKQQKCNKCVTKKGAAAAEISSAQTD